MKTNRKTIILIIIALCITSTSCLGSIAKKEDTESIPTENEYLITEENTQPNPTPPTMATSTESPQSAGPEVLWEVNHGAFPDSVNSNLLPFVGLGEIKIYTETYDHGGTKFLPVFERGYDYDGTNVYTTTPANNPVAYDLQTGAQVWISDMEGEVIGVGENTVFIYTVENRVYGLDKTNGSELWKIIVEGLLPSNPELNPFTSGMDPSDQDGELYDFVFHNNGEYIIPAHINIGAYHYSIRFLHINEINGEAYFSPLNESIDSLIHPLFYLDNILICNDSHSLYAIDIMDGSIIWKWNGEGPFRFTGGIIGTDQQNEVLYLTGEGENGFQHSLFALNLLTGEPVWENIITVPDTESEFSNSTGKFILQKYFYFAYTSSVYIYDISTGKRINRITSDYSIRILPTDQGLIIYNLDLGIAEGVDPITGEVLWQDDEFKYEQWYYAYQNILYYLNEDRRLEALDIYTGDILWTLDDVKMTIELASNSRNFLDGNLNLIKVGNHLIYLLDLNTGKIENIELTGNWTPNRGKEHIQILNDQTWIYFGELLGVIKP